MASKQDLQSQGIPLKKKGGRVFAFSPSIFNCLLKQLEVKERSQKKKIANDLDSVIFLLSVAFPFYKVFDRFEDTRAGYMHQIKSA